MGTDVRHTNFHVSAQELLEAADGELSPRKMAKVQAHLAACWSCRARMREIETTIVDFVRVHQRNLDEKVPPAGGPRRLFQARLAEIAGSPEPDWRLRLLLLMRRRELALGGLALALVALTMLSLSILPRPDPNVSQQRNPAVPDPRLTPGMTQPLSKAELCSLGDQDSAPAVPRAVALKVFAAYGVSDPRPRAFELDYLVAPELGGTNDIRNLWPQPYRTLPWDAHAKDALEDHLYGLVCQGSLDLATAQEDIARDWIAAYRKYFRTETPLPVHAAFLKDRPWE
jgi:predicted anti-sigma-YlaC factor YlaD